MLYTTDGDGGRDSLNLMGTSGNVIATARGTGSSESWYLYNKDCRESASSIIDGNGELVTAYEYDEFGETTVIAGQSFDNEICYTGQVYDRNAGLYYYNARFYDSEDGRFLTQDTYRGTKNNPETLHLYAYCYNNPIVNIDPSGHWVYSIGIEGQIAIGAGVYGGYALNIDSKGKCSVTASAGFLAVSNAVASITVSVAGYKKYNSVRSVEGVGITAGFAFACGYKVGASAGLAVSLNGKVSESACVSYGPGVSALNELPYFELKAGTTWGKLYFSVNDVFKWKKGKQKTYKRGGLSFSVKRTLEFIVNQ